jgi:uncharacterized membrane protein HdeD (DUF308 family)
MSASNDPNLPGGNPAAAGSTPNGTPQTPARDSSGAVPPPTPVESSAGGVSPTTPAAGSAETAPPSTSAGGDTGRGSLPAGAGDPAMCAVLAENWWAMALRGVFGILFGLIALFAPGPTILSLVLLFSAYMLVDGVFGIISAVRAAGRHERWGLLLLEGLVNIAAGVVAFLLPGLTVIVFVLLMAAWALVSGGLMLGAAFKLTQQHGRWWLALGGVVSMIYGVLLAIAPLIGALVLTWWLGAYALAFGVILLVLAFRLRGQKNQGTDSGKPLPQGT